MYDRAVRELEWPTGSTPEDVGPGTYYVAKWDIPQDNVGAPFLSLSRRNACSRYLTDLPEVSPGPSYYDPLPVYPRVQGCSTLTDTEKRFRGRYSDVPGPGYYNLKRYSENTQPHRDPVPVVAEAASANAGKIIAKYKWRRGVIVPSIPSRGVSLGFVEQPDGTLRKVCPIQGEPLIGPTTYDQTMNETRATRQYRGVHFGLMGPRKTSTYLCNKAIGPGPGTYDIGDWNSVGKAAKDAAKAIKDSVGAVAEARTVVHNISGAPFTSSRKTESNVPRYNEALIKQTVKMNIPGPGKYQIRSQFDPEPSRLTPLEGLTFEKPPFLSQTKRFLYKHSSVPPPGSYEDPRHAFTVLNRKSGMTHSPFGQTAVRFEGKSPKGKGTPGPGAYTLRGMALESQRRAFHHSTHKGIFGSTAPRGNPGPTEEARDLPGPAHYQVKDKPFKANANKPSATFTSSTYRALSQPNSDLQELPPPGQYNVEESYLKSQVLKREAKPRTAAAAKMQGSFASSAPRFSRDRSLFVPGPGAYETCGRAEPSKGGLMVTRDKRFKQTKNPTPGPNTYVLAPAIQDSVRKGTFNITLTDTLSPSPYP